MAKSKKVAPEKAEPKLSDLYGDIVTVAGMLGMDIDKVCTLAKVHRTTVSRWKVAPPKTIKNIESILLAVNTELEKQGKPLVSIIIKAIPAAA
jgi:hypothetical protein